MRQTGIPRKQHRVDVIGLSGGAGSGKTEAALFFSRRGCQVVNLDQVGRDILAEDPTIAAAIFREFGDGVLDESGSVNRSVLRQLVFSDSANLARLDALFYPQFRARMQTLTNEFRRTGNGTLVIDGAIVHHAGIDQFCDRTILIRADRETRIRRLSRRMSITPEDAGAMADQQEAKLPAPEDVDYLLDNDGTLAELHEKLECFLGRE